MWRVALKENDSGLASREMWRVALKGNDSGLASQEKCRGDPERRVKSIRGKPLFFRDGLLSFLQPHELHEMRKVNSSL
jgi:hypothetical protein